MSALGSISRAREGEEERERKKDIRRMIPSAPVLLRFLRTPIVCEANLTGESISVSRQRMSGIVQYVVVRGDLTRTMGWPLGAVVAQACHACTAIIHLFYNDVDTQAYLADLDNMHKVVLEVSIVTFAWELASRQSARVNRECAERIYFQLLWNSFYFVRVKYSRL